MSIHKGVQKIERSPLMYVLVAAIAIMFGLPAAALLPSGKPPGAYEISGVVHADVSYEGALLGRWFKIVNQGVANRQRYLQGGMEGGFDMEQFGRVYAFAEVCEKEFGFAAAAQSLFATQIKDESNSWVTFDRGLKITQTASRKWAIARIAVLHEVDTKGIRETDQEVRDFTYAIFGKAVTAEEFKQLAPLVANMEPQELETKIRESIRIHTYLDLATDGVQADGEEILKRFVDDNTQYVGDYVEFKAEDFKGAVVEVTAQEKQDWYREHNKEFEKPAEIALHVLHILDESLIDEAEEPTEEAIQEYYDANKVEFIVPEEVEETADDSAGEEESSVPADGNTDDATSAEAPADDAGDAPADEEAPAEDPAPAEDKADEDGLDDQLLAQADPADAPADPVDEPATPEEPADEPVTPEEQPADAPEEPVAGPEDPADTPEAAEGEEEGPKEIQYKPLEEVRDEIVRKLKLEECRTLGLLRFKEELQQLFQKLESEGRNMSLEGIADQIEGAGFEVTADMERGKYKSLEDIVGKFEDASRAKLFDSQAFDVMEVDEIYNFVQDSPFRAEKGWFIFQLAKQTEPTIPLMEGGIEVQVEAKVREEKAKDLAVESAEAFLAKAQADGWEKALEGAKLTVQTTVPFKKNGAELEAMAGRYAFAEALAGLEQGGVALVSQGMPNVVVGHLKGEVPPARDAFKEQETSIRTEMERAAKQKQREYLVQSIAEAAGIVFPDESP